jgi:type II secretory pathway component GspD/PulD (secretin)
MRVMIPMLVSALLIAVALAGGVNDKELDLLAAAQNRVLVKFRDTSLTKVFQSLAVASDTTITVLLKQDKLVSVNTGEVSLKEALTRLAESYDLVYEVKSPRELIVRSAGEKEGAS